MTADIPGPWTHRDVSAGGTRFHLVEQGEGPLVLLLHGFPEFWWSWHHQLTALAAAGYRAVAVDLRGYGGSDKPPRGYDLITLAGDAAGLIRALGEANGVVVGHDWGGMLAWTMAVYQPKVVQRLVAVSAPHPLRLRQSKRTSWMAHAARFQVPIRPEKTLVKDDGAYVSRLVDRWSASGWPDATTDRHLRDAIRIPGVAHSSLEYHRWFLRSQFRPDGLRYAHRMAAPVLAPTLHLHGALDPALPPYTAQGSGRYVEAPYTWTLIEAAGHFPHEERPNTFNDVLLGWLER